MMKPDADVRRDVLAELACDPAIDATGIHVAVHGGVVKLSGSVPSLTHVLQVEDAAQRVCGVKAITVELNVKLPEATESSDEDLAHSARQILDWTSSLCSDAIHLVVEDGWITLSGEVPWQYQKLSAEEQIRRIRGLKGLVNNIGLRQIVTPDTIQSNVEAALARAHQSNISVRVHEGEVTLSGSVESMAQRDFAEHAAWRAVGVRNVVDAIQIAPNHSPSFR
jgi:osmotically-inducible protein OsmY